ncbi:hypothetical protein C8J56DRAFT_1078103 [Mycena floridula]|nr:hypothetical protein C8J56DRAFT_1078103 [Mycena floridula]
MSIPGGGKSGGGGGDLKRVGEQNQWSGEQILHTPLIIEWFFCPYFKFPRSKCCSCSSWAAVVPVERNGKESGDQTLTVATVVGLHTMTAISVSNPTQILDRIEFAVITSPVTTPAVKSNLGPESSTGTSEGGTSTLPTSLSIAEASSSFGPLKSASTTTGFDNGLPTRSIVPDPMKSKARLKVSALTAGIIGALLGSVGLVSFWICIHQRKRRQRLNLAATPYDVTSSHNGIRALHVPLIESVLISKRSLRTASDTPQWHAVEPRDISESAPTERQRSLQARVADIDRQLEESEAALQNMPDASLQLTRALIVEIRRLQRENQVLRDINHSDWALGLLDVPPPSYPHSQASSQ